MNGMRALLIGAFLVSTASAVGAETICPMIYQPVCAARDGATLTFANRCLAEGAGYRVVNAGRCGDGGSRSKLRTGRTDGSALQELAAAPQCPALFG